jgi:thioredoxin reductase (NADPH)
MNDIFDLIIVGMGPASVTAHVYALRYNMKVLAIGGIPGGLMMETHKICNWPGEIAITGAELSQKMMAQLQAMDANIVMEMVSQISGQINDFTVTTVSGKSFQSKRVLIATGTKHRHLGIDNEERLTGRGVAYCATCDAMFYKGRITAVTGGGNSAMTSALYLADLCPRVYLIYRGQALKGEEALKDEISKKSNITVIAQNNITAIKGEDKVTGLVLEHEFERQSELTVDGLFVEIGTLPLSDLAKDLGVELDEYGFVKVGQDQSTSLAGVYAAGDLTNASNNFRQIATAVGEGATAANAIYSALKK